LQVALPSGRTVPLSQFVSFGYEQDFPLVWRRDRVPTLTVQADVATGATPEGAVAAPAGSAAPRVTELAAAAPAHEVGPLRGGPPAKAAGGKAEAAAAAAACSAAARIRGGVAEVAAAVPARPLHPAVVHRRQRLLRFLAPR
jgi:hypothetical protein